MCERDCDHDEIDYAPWRFTIPLPGHNAFETWKFDDLVDKYHSALSIASMTPEGSFLRVGDLRSRDDMREFLELFRPFVERRERPQWPPWSGDVDFSRFAPVCRPLLDKTETSIQSLDLAPALSSSSVLLDSDDEDSIASRVRASSVALYRHTETRSKVLEAMFRLRCPRMAMRYAQCCGSGSVLEQRAPDGTSSYTVSLNRCRSRFCPHCARLRASRLSARLGPVINAMRSPKMLTLTLRQSEGEFLHDTIERLHRSWRKLLRSPKFREHVAGGIAIMECKRGREGWNCHYHVVAEAKYYPVRELSALWERCTGDSPIVDVRRISRDDLARYLAKYVAKPLANVPDDDIAELIFCLHGRRMLNKFGYLAKFPGLSDDSLDTDPEQKDSVFVCSWFSLLRRAQQKEAKALYILRCVFAKPDPASRDGTSSEFQPDLFAGMIPPCPK